ncbi:PolC-type DNA polymerase III [Williamsia sp. D3]|uniref:3'-5' exonuclease n=1 Tax=Williamsia sp. D3 TaxID=1313067 RepID=UPI0003D33907|nr:3'-5' exonuclease [Williamsia sp. D3]ETD33264.1 exonuclease [Williamsia sp. D3]
MRFRRRTSDADASVSPASWKSWNYLVIDLETSGFDPVADQINSIGAVPIDGGRIMSSAAHYSLVHSSRRISEEAVKIHGIRSEDTAAAPSLADCVDRFDNLMRGRVLVAHGAHIERAFLRRAFRHTHREFAQSFIDTAVLARDYLDVDMEPHQSISLEFVAEQMNLPIHTPHHALGDAMTTAIVFTALATKLEESGNAGAVSLLSRCS